VRLLIKAECCDSVAGELTRPALIWRALATHNNQNARIVSVYNIARAGHGLLPIPEEYTEERQVQDEITRFGFPRRCHPLELYRQTIEQLCPIAIWSSTSVSTSPWGAGCSPRRWRKTKHSEPMEFLTFEDKTAMYDATLFPMRIGGIAICLRRRRAMSCEDWWKRALER
jgi:error-prone DNA polymerase